MNKLDTDTTVSAPTKSVAAETQLRHSSTMLQRTARSSKVAKKQNYGSSLYLLLHRSKDGCSQCTDFARSAALSNLKVIYSEAPSLSTIPVAFPVSNIVCSLRAQVALSTVFASALTVGRLGLRLSDTLSCNSTPLSSVKIINPLNLSAGEFIAIAVLCHDDTVLPCKAFQISVSPQMLGTSCACLHPSTLLGTMRSFSIPQKPKNGCSNPGLRCQHLC